MIVGYKTPRGKLVMAERAVPRGPRVMTKAVTPRGSYVARYERSAPGDRGPRGPRHQP